MKPSRKKQRLTTDILIALAISVIVNVSYFLFLFSSHQPPRGGSGTPAPTGFNYLSMIIQVCYYFVLAFILIKVSTTGKNKSFTYSMRLIVCVFIAVVFYFMTPGFNREGKFIILLFGGRRMVNPMTILKTSFTFLVAVLYAKIYQLVYQRQNIMIENQSLKTENLQSRYTTLVNQINPHFFFNSLNSLAMLVRDKQNDNALEYIDRLSDTFRYIIQNSEKGMVSVDEELGFLDAYKYLFEIRYADKLFFNIDIDPEYVNWTLPSLALQPLIENAVKHNTITKSNPLTVYITVKDGYLIVSNPIHPKIEPEPGTGVGVHNLASRYLLLTGKEIACKSDGNTFTVELPLTPYA